MDYNATSCSVCVFFDNANKCKKYGKEIPKTFDPRRCKHFKRDENKKEESACEKCEHNYNSELCEFKIKYSDEIFTYYRIKCKALASCECENITKHNEVSKWKF